MKIRCRLFGHKLPIGYHGDHPYLTRRFKAVDGMGAHHVDLRGDCDRCGSTVTFAYLHLPEPRDPRWFDTCHSESAKSR